MNLPLLAAKNVLRNRFRTILTVAGVTVSILAFILLRTVLTSWNAAAEYSVKDRLATRSRISWVVMLQKSFQQQIKDMPGVRAVAHLNWFGGKDKEHKKEFFTNFAVDTENILAVYPEMVIDENQKKDWIDDQKGALVGDRLAKRMGWKKGSHVTLTGAVYPFDLDFNVQAIYTAKKQGVDRNMFMFHFKYLDGKLPVERRNRVGWYAVGLNKGVSTAEMSKTIDDHFRNSPFPTLTMSELELNRSFLAIFSAILKAINVVSLVIMAIMMLILGNTIAMGVRERTNEYGVLRAIGFLPRHVALFVLFEAVTIGVVGAAIGVLIGYPLVNKGVGRYLEENMTGFFPYFGVASVTIIAALVLAIVLAALAAALPAYRASKLSVVDALRKVG